MKATYEPVCGIIRIIDGDHHGDPVRHAVTARWHDVQTIEICGLDKKLDLEEARSLLELVRLLRAKVLIQRRCKNGEWHEHRWEI